MNPSLADTALSAVHPRVAIVDRTGEIVYASRPLRGGRDDASPLPSSDGDSDPFLEAISAAGRDDVRFLEVLADATDPDLNDLADAIRSLLTGDSDRDLVHRHRISREGYTAQVLLYPIEHEGVTHVMLVDEGPTHDVDARLKERTLDEAPIGITIGEPTTEDGDNPLVYVNDAFEEITGYRRGEALGRDCRFMQGERTDEDTVAEMREAVDERETVTTVVRNYRKNGEGFWNEITIAPLYDETGDLTNFVGFQQDVTVREEAERKLKTERDRLALLNQIVRHDIRNDMSVVLGWADILEEHVRPEGMDAFGQILDAATHTRDLTESVRDITDVLGTADPELEVISLAEVLRTEIEQVRSNFDYRVESLTVRGGDELPEDVEVLATPLLSSVFTNLLNNAVLHSQGDVEIDVSVDVDEETVTVRIADNGPGVPDAQKEDIFGKGVQGLDSDGTGLGLYLVDNLVDTYGGDVWVSDDDPEGSVFSVELRRADRGPAN